MKWEAWIVAGFLVLFLLALVSEHRDGEGEYAGALRVSAVVVFGALIYLVVRLGTS